MDAITGPITTPPPPGAAGGTSDIFSSDGFLNLLAAQIRGQNPLEPMTDTEFVAQMAQFSQLEQLTHLRANTEDLAIGGRLAQGAALLGKDVEYSVAGGVTASGTVESLSVSASGATTLIVDGQAVDLGQVVSVS